MNNRMVLSYLKDSAHRALCAINPKIEMRRWYKKAFGVNPNIEHPSNLLEKIYWMLLHTDTSLWTKCADKYLARGYITECGYSSFLPRLYGKWDNPEDVSFENLPVSFVLKANNGCGTVYVVKDKNKEDIRKVRRMAKQWLAIPYGYSGGEIHYTKIRPCIIAEELLINDYEHSLSPHSMVDFKVWCINGEPESILLVYDRNCGHYLLDLYDLKWNRMESSINLSGGHKFADALFPKPNCLDEMLIIAKNVSRSFPEVRVDFYIVKDKPLIGELTFTTGFGYFTKEYYEYLGSKIDLSKLNRIK